MDRRTFLQAVGAGTAVSLLPPSLVEALARPAPTGGLGLIEHVVIFMQENRSFDHYFGTLRGVRGFGDRNAVLLNAKHSADGKTSRSVLHQPDQTHPDGYVLPYAVDTHQLVGTAHGWDDGHEAWNRGRYDNWIPAKSRYTMCHYERDDLPFYYSLADAFTICDSYHCSVMSGTSPNRSHLFTGMIGYEPDGRRAIGNAAYAEDSHGGYDWTTYVERLDGMHSWQVYQEWDNYQDNNLEFHRPFKAVARKVLAELDLRSMHTFYERVREADSAERKRLFSALEDGVRTLNAVERRYYDGALRRVKPGRLASTFAADVAADALPTVSWLVAPEDQCEHPSSDGPSTGSELVWQALEALAANEKVWNKTVFLLTYDENDGYFDHVPPPVPPVAEAAEYVDGQPIGLGPRVPMLVVSPWSRGGAVCSEIFDHTSILRLLEHVTGVGEPNIGAWRRAVCGDLTSALDLDSSGSYPDFERPTPTQGSGPRKPSPPENQTFPRQESGSKIARPTPYQLDGSARQDVSAGRIWIDMSNVGTGTAHFSVYANRYRTDGPWRYDIAANDAQSDYFSVRTYGDGQYDLSLYGPNGFQRRFTGDLDSLGATTEANSIIEPETEGGIVTLTFTNVGTSDVTFTVTANGYRTDGPWTYGVPANSSVSDRWHVGWYGDRWYDLIVTIDIDPSFSRRFLGHLENGKAGVTG
ncbi:phosphocholine-specific phospholipase C [Amycolatopsis cihanbeyliensis]|uniref:phospholipase C n=1 Tax=Amycolatopsis cihanbeyliensis TaxID=1128664 RepID=A0A542DF74_AMYCI|nr:phospholipase C, phosphocholine-specific [Amycolatopsis cihanbeyliensis]TQJ01714.1 phospholipase C [Amycolatopsis cihanbeyliensis]